MGLLEGGAIVQHPPVAARVLQAEMSPAVMGRKALAPVATETMMMRANSVMLMMTCAQSLPAQWVQPDLLPQALRRHWCEASRMASRSGGMPMMRRPSNSGLSGSLVSHRQAQALDKDRASLRQLGRRLPLLQPQPIRGQTQVVPPLAHVRGLVAWAIREVYGLLQPFQHLRRCYHRPTGTQQELGQRSGKAHQVHGLAAGPKREVKQPPSSQFGLTSTQMLSGRTLQHQRAAALLLHRATCSIHQQGHGRGRCHLPHRARRCPGAVPQATLLGLPA
mmetsp:Transcript_41971/g.76270  ORF Transcript_41971/g.76270 Transcript_41971/m.76270 type:complete len:277 (+) Transcript_41971:362-1192(+)